MTDKEFDALKEGDLLVFLRSEVLDRHSEYVEDDSSAAKVTYGMVGRLARKQDNRYAPPNYNKIKEAQAKASLDGVTDVSGLYEEAMDVCVEFDIPNDRVCADTEYLEWWVSSYEVTPVTPENYWQIYNLCGQQETHKLYPNFEDYEKELNQEFFEFI